jgi:HlyD family secretion protein
MKRLGRWALILLALFVILTVGYSALPASWKGTPQVNFRTAKVVRGDIVYTVNSTGTVQPVQSVQVGAFVSGPIETANVDFNSIVKTGDVLARIDPRLFQATIARDEAVLAVNQFDVERVEALLEQATKNEQRALALKKAKDSYISDTELDQVVAERKSLAAQLAVAKAAVTQAEASLTLSRANLEYTVIKSPVDGVIIDRKIDPGQTVAAQFQTPVLFVVAPDMQKRMYVNASVDEADIGLIRQAQRNKEPVTFTVDAYPDDLFTGRIHQVRLNSVTTNNVVTYTVVVEAPNAELKLLPGMTASLSFQVEKRAAVLRIPNAALRYYPRPELVRPEDRSVLEGQELEPEDEATETQPSAGEKVLSARERRKRHVWVAEGPLLRAIKVTTGLSDNKFTELVSGSLKDAQPLVTGIRSPLWGPPQ